MADSQLSVPCLRCDLPAAAHGEHHEPTKGMGGQGPKVAAHPRVPRFRGCHEAVHDARFVLELEGDIARTLEAGLVVSERATRVDDESLDPRYWSTEKLCGDWEYSEQNALDALFQQCRRAWVFYQRYRWMETWYERAAEMITEKTGKFVYWRRVYERVALWEVFGERRDDYAFLGPRIAIAVAEDKDPEEALAIATVAKDNEHLVKDVVAMVKTRDRARAATPPPSCECPNCGARHRKKVGG